MKKLLFLFWWLPLVTSATHIVGGEILMKHLEGDRYELSLNLYFDENKGSLGAIDPYNEVGVFRLRDHQFVRSINLQQINWVPVLYTNEACRNDELSTRHYLYRTEIELDPAVYNDPMGYYFSWERCCRNEGIVNIYTPEAVGQAFYLEFSVVDDAQRPLYNTSPQLFPPVSDYACLGSEFYFDFSGRDPDGDSLVYSLAVPKKGSTETGAPRHSAPISGPYAEVDWKPGFSREVQIMGTPPLSVDSLTGLLRVTASRLGLHVFAVKCEEFRAGRKIGEVHREFQMLVLDCLPNQPPAGTVIDPETGVAYQTGDTIHLTDVQRCVQVIAADPDTNTRLSVRAVGVNFQVPRQVARSESREVNTPQHPLDSTELSLCFDACLPDLGEEPMIVDVIVQDDGCSVPKTDTVRIILTAEPLPNAPPQLGALTARAGDTIPVAFDQPFRLAVFATDPEGRVDNIDVTFANEQHGQFYFNQRLASDTVFGDFYWYANCNLFQGEAGGIFPLRFVVKENDCFRPQADTLQFWVQVGYDSVGPPALVLPDTVFVHEGDSVDIPFAALAADSVPLDLFVEGIGLNIRQEGMQIASDSGYLYYDYWGERYTFYGTYGQASGTLSWQPECEAVQPGVYKIAFSAAAHYCVGLQSGGDTLNIVVLPRTNAAPRLQLVTDTLHVWPGGQWQVAVRGVDPDRNNPTLSMEGQGFQPAAQNMVLTTSYSDSVASGRLTFQPSCAMAGTTYHLTFRVEDHPCGPSAQDSADLWIHVRDDDSTARLTSSLSAAPYLEVLAGKDTTFTLFGDDLDSTYLMLEAKGLGFSLEEMGMQFEAQAGQFHLSAPFRWQADCSQLPASPLQVLFLLTEQTCPEPRYDSLIVTLAVIDSADRDFETYNVFSPNGDGRNEVFHLPDLPPDNCYNAFVGIRIYNRWGKEVFTSERRDFVWTGEGAPAGTYFYVVEYLRNQRKGWVQVIR
ncbi:gliding motility-associated C-terminal domain-containing protein [Catalinimonas alkaloidigena]|uniref:Gliding motility-associated C-terminal domain-containing protein n=1 Tax=Catalinimonas alkaloidigena TaxID=1075417 RepID=A0A1G8XW79_9BACT|nr:gliding motility-associated C-terminal domain-containing protein [Catalinimonas alkaloidigena]SDJ94798.1 gliding motility-associated C-terminal domain-containing protein [Catalinimonas alkaloidigena]